MVPSEHDLAVLSDQRCKGQEVGEDHHAGLVHHERGHLEPQRWVRGVARLLVKLSGQLEERAGRSAQNQDGTAPEPVHVGDAWLGADGADSGGEHVVRAGVYLR